MKQQEVFKKIGVIIGELNDQYAYLKESVENLNDLELELFVANTHFLSDHAAILRKLNGQNQTQQQLEQKLDPHLQQKYFEPEVRPLASNEINTQYDTSIEASSINELHKTPEPDSENSSSNNSAPEIDIKEESQREAFSYIREEPEPFRHELILDETNELEDDGNEPNKIEEIVEVEQKTELGNLHSSNIEDLDILVSNHQAQNTNKEAAEEVLTINQMISAQLNTKPAEHLTLQPVTDLKSAITLNDKLLYVKDLFNGYSLAYNEAIEILNRLNNFDEADRFLRTNYITKHDWEGKQATADKFYALLHRRFPPAG